jgi:hypothetical protein
MALNDMCGHLEDGSDRRWRGSEAESSE